MLRRLINRLHRGPVIYDDNFFQEAWFKEWMTLSSVLKLMLESEPNWKSVLDFGCGPGVMIDLMVDSGLDYVGCDYSAEARQLYLSNYGRYCERYLTTIEAALASKRDLLLAFDVLEHLQDEEIATLLETTAVIPEMLFNISRTRGIPGHVNIKSDRAWLTFMQAHGLHLEQQRTQALRQLYAKLRPGSPDRWDKNLFLFRRVPV
jgi:2-polyprenyl-3-methyl-5-hydroxy-6-metoxy-1,4-benzoquinol methylase